MRTIARALLLTLAGTAVGLAVNAARPDGVKLGSVILAEAAAEQSACVAPTTLPSVAIADALKLHGHPDVRFADVRDDKAYAEGHVAGAFHLPCGSSPPTYLHALESGARTVVIYGVAGDDARWVADALRKTGVPDVRVLQGSFADWHAAGGPAEAGACDACGAP